MKSPRFKTALAALLFVLLAVNSASAAGEHLPPWSQDFESDSAGWLDNDDIADYGQIVQVASGTNGITSASGTGHAEVSGTPGESAPYSRFGGFSSVWPGEWTAEIDVYLDPDALPSGAGFDYAVAANGTNGDHKRDFIFHVSRYDTDGVKPVRIVVGATNNTNFAPRMDLESLANHYVIQSGAGGWYTLQHRFYDVGGVLHVDLNLLDAVGTVLFTETRTTPADTIPDIVGGNRYAWFTFINGGPFAIDNHELGTADSWEVVSPANVAVDWFTADTRDGGNIDFLVGKAPSGIGSLSITTTDANGGSSNAKAQFLTYEYIGVPLANINAMSFFTYRDSSSTNSTAQTIGLNLEVDFVGDGSSFTTLVFEPIYQPGGIGAMQVDTWQRWEAFKGGDAIWWSSKDIPGVCAFTCYVKWSDIILANPNAKIKFGVGFSVGSGWAGQFSGKADALRIGVAGNTTVYDFEPQTLYIEDDAINMHGHDTFTVPVMLSSSGNALSSVSFTVAWDQACVAFDSETDSNNDGIPNSITGLPNSADFHITVTRNETDPNVTILVKPHVASPPLPVLIDGVLATLEFDASACDSSGAVVPVSFTFPASTTPSVVPSYGNSDGQSTEGATEDGTITLTFNVIPSDIHLDDNLVNENQPAGTTVGTLCTDDDTPDGTDCGPLFAPFTYSLVNEAGCASTGNNAFQIGGIGGNELKTAGLLNREALGGFTYDVCVRSQDAYGLSMVKSFQIVVENVNEAPTNIGLSGTSVDENTGAPVAVGTLSTTDEDAGDSHTYTFCSTSPEFQINGSTLETTSALNFENQDSYNVCIRSTDLGTLFVERTFTISVDDENDAPVAENDPSPLGAALVVIGDGSTVPIDVLANDHDQDGDVLSVNAVVTEADHGVTGITVDQKKVNYTADEGYNGPDSFTYTAKDGDGAVSNEATVSLHVVANDIRADCNADGQIDAADFPATVLEIFDTDDSYHWWKTYTGSFPGSPLGCDSNASKNGLSGTTPSVDSADIICTVLIFFGNNSCTQAVRAAAAAKSGTFLIPTELLGAAGETIAVPVTLDTAGNRVAAATFALSFEGAGASFDPADSNGDGVPDAITLNVPASMAKAVSYDAKTNVIQVAVYSTNLPMAVLEDGVLATINLTVRGEGSELSITRASLGSDAGQSIPVIADGLTEPTQGDDFIFLPMLGQ